jgi:hypothetical protein
VKKIVQGTMVDIKVTHLEENIALILETGTYQAEIFQTEKERNTIRPLLSR